MFNLLVCCLFSYAVQIATAEYRNITMSIKGPVSVGDTATFTCTAFPDKLDHYQPEFLDWNRVEGYWPLIIDIRQGKVCNLDYTPNTLKSYTFEHTCDAEQNQYTLSIVNVTERDLNSTWCCKFQKGLRECAIITDARAVKTTSVTPRNRNEASRIPEVTEPSVIPKVIESSTTAARGTMPGSSCQLWILLFAVLILCVNL